MKSMFDIIFINFYFDYFNLTQVTQQCNTILALLKVIQRRWKLY